MPNRLKSSYTDTTMWASNIIIKELYLLKNHASNFLLSLNEKQKHNLGALSNSHVNFSPKDEVRRLKESAAAAKSISRVWLLATPWTAAYQALPSVGFSRQEYWSGMPLPSPGILYKTSKFYPVKIFVLFYTTFNAQFCVALRIMLRIQDLSSGWKFKVM